MIKKQRKNSDRKGFTLLETLIVLTIIAAAVGMIITLANPLEQFAKQRNNERKAEATAILDAISQYKTDNAGVFSCETTFSDASGEGNMGKCSGGNCPDYIEDGRFGKAVRFDGENDFIEVVWPNSLDITGNLTVSAWVRPSVGYDNFSAGWNLFASQINSLKYEFGFTGEDGPKFQVYNDSGSAYDVGGGLTYASGTWHNVVGVRDGTSVEVYSDGELVDSRNDFSGSLRDGQEVLIGGNGDGDGFHGDVDDMIIYDRALSEGEVRDMSEGIISTGADLVMHFSGGASTVPTSTTPIASDGFNIAECLVPEYIQIIPFDPSDPRAHFTDVSDYDSGYTISRNEDTGRITISAPSAELGEDISLTR